MPPRAAASAKASGTLVHACQAIDAEWPGRARPGGLAAKAQPRRTARDAARPTDTLSRRRLGSCAASQPRIISQIYADYPQVHVQHAANRPFPALENQFLQAVILQSCSHGASTGCGRQALHPRRAGAQPPPLIARPAPGAGGPATSAQLAWEILRRRQDYEGQPARRQILRANPALLLIDAAPPPGDWGLRFRRGPGPASGRSLPVLGRRARWQRHPRRSGPRRESG